MQCEDLRWVIPAIDLKDGHCVRLEQGDMARATVFNRDPAAQAHAFEQPECPLRHAAVMPAAGHDPRQAAAQADSQR